MEDGEQKRGRFDKVLKYIWIFDLMILMFSIGVIFTVNTIDRTNNGLTKLTGISDVSDCENKTILEASYCLRNWINGFYNYTIRDDTIKTLEDIKKNGGDCYDYNENLYVSAGNQLGYYMSTHSFRIGESWHVVTFISDSTGYCVLDLNNIPNCYYTERGKQNESKV